jgi:hypothetical protein
MTRVIAALLAAAIVTPAVAADSVTWSLSKKDGRPYLVGMWTAEEEGDTEFWAHCRKGGAIELGVGASSGVGKGTGDAVSLTLKSGTQSAKLEGKSRRSVNFEMTAGHELRAQTTANEPVFGVLATGGPISVTGSIEKPITWPARGLKAKVAAFLAACKK